MGIERVLGRYERATAANPVPGIVQALGQLPAPLEGDAKIQVCVIGERLVSSGESVLCRLDELNPTDANGQRRARISAVQVAGGARETRATRQTAEATGADATFAKLMSEVARQHGGTFRAMGGGGR